MCSNLFSCRSTYGYEIEYSLPQVLKQITWTIEAINKIKEMTAMTKKGAEKGARDIK